MKMRLLLLFNEEKSRMMHYSSVVRAIKTVFFLIAMMLSLLVFSAPVLLAVADTILPSALLSASLSADHRISSASGAFLHSFIGPSLLSLLKNYDFRYSLVDIPLVSIARSVVILCVYSWCDGPSLSRGPYLWVATGCSLASLSFVSLKASYVFGGGGGGGPRFINNNIDNNNHNNNINGMKVALFCCSYALAVAHVAVAYRTSCRERKKLLIYRIDVEAGKKAFPMYQKKLLHADERMK